MQEDRAKAVGAWSGLGGVAGAIGPFLGGWLVSAAGWRWVFLINLPLAAIVVAVTVRHVPETRDETTQGRFDVRGAALAALALAGITYALTEAPQPGASLVVVIVAAVLGVACGAGFVLTERERTRTGKPEAMMPLDVFASKEFTAVNVVTFVVYGGMGVVFFLFVVTLQVVAGYSPIAAGAATVPITVLMLLLSARAGALAQKIGPRIPMTAGLVVVTIGMVLMTRIGLHTSYLTEVLPAVVVFALGLSAVVAPLTATMLATADVRHAGVASGVNNAVARAASLLFVAAIPPLAGLTGDAQSHPLVFLHGFRIAIVASAALVACGAVLSFFTIRDDALRATPAAQARMHDQLRGRRAAPRTGAEGRPGRPPEARHARGGLTPSAGCSALGSRLRPEAAVTRASTAAQCRDSRHRRPACQRPQGRLLCRQACSRRPSSM